MEATPHLDILSLFCNIWCNPQTKSHAVLKYLLRMADINSLTWSAHVRLVFQLYNLPDPILLLETRPWPKESWRRHTMVAVTSHHEAVLRLKSLSNMKLQYLNVQASGLSGRPHPVLAWVQTTQDVVKIRPHLKMLAGDYLCYSYIAHDRGTDPYCRMCNSLSHTPAPAEDMVHMLTRCRATADTRNRILPELLNTVASFYEGNTILSSPSHDLLTQFILDCSSLNLPPTIRVHPEHPSFNKITMQCSSLIYAIHRDRTRQLKAIGFLR